MYVCMYVCLHICRDNQIRELRMKEVHTIRVVTVAALGIWLVWILEGGSKPLGVRQDSRIKIIVIIKKIE